MVGPRGGRNPTRGGFWKASGQRSESLWLMHFHKKKRTCGMHFPRHHQEGALDKNPTGRENEVDDDKREKDEHLRLLLEHKNFEKGLKEWNNEHPPPPYYR